MSDAVTPLDVFRQGSPRLRLAAAPPAVQLWLERALGSPVVAASSEAGGFSPGVAARVVCADGTRAFVKAVGTALNPEAPALMRQEIRVLGELPATSLRPRVLDSYDDGDWVALLLEEIDGTMPELPWRADQLERVLGALDELAALHTPSPWAGAPSIAVHRAGLLTSWEDLEPAELELLDPWSRRHLDGLVDLGRQALASQVGGVTLCHVDTRSDNILLTGDRVVLVDWNWASVGPAWFDPAMLLLEVRAAGGPDPDAIAAGHAALAAVPSEVLTAFVAAVTGMFVRNSRRPSPPGLPTLRAFQSAYADAGLAWTRERTGWA